MNAPSTGGTLLLSELALPTVLRFIEVDLPAGRGPTIAIRRTTLDGAHAGQVRIFPEALDLLHLALDHARRGALGFVGCVGSVSCVVLERGVLAIGLRDEAGEPMGRPSTIRGEELERLAEAACIAAHEAAA